MNNNDLRKKLEFKKCIRFCNDCFIDQYNENEKFQVCELIETQFTKLSISILRWTAVKFFDSKEEAQLYCDIQNLKIGNKNDLQEKYKTKIDEMNNEIRKTFKKWSLL